MSVQKFVAGATLIGMLAGLLPAAAMANGAASTRNILLLGGAAATYLVIQHNKKVHAQQAAQAERQASTQESANNAWAAYSSEKNAYSREAALNADLNREVAFQHSVIEQQQKMLASAGLHPTYAAQPGHVTRAASSGHGSSSTQVAATTSGWGWGTI